MPLLLILSVLFAYSDATDLKGGIYLWLTYALLMAVAALLLTGACYLSVGVHARRMFKQQLMQPENQLTWSDEGMSSENKFGVFKADWSDFFGWSENRGAFTILINEGYFYLIPAHSLSAAEATDLRTTLSRSGLISR